MPKKPPPETPLYVRLPNAAVEKLDRAAAALGMRKKDLVANLVTRYVDPDSQQGLSALSAKLGSYSFKAYASELPEILSAEQAGQFLQIPEQSVIELAEAGELPGKKLGTLWRFAREALVAWLSTGA